MTLQELCTSLAELKAKVEAENVERAKVRFGEAFTALTKQIDALVAKQDELLAGLPDSSLEYDSLRKEIIERMKEEKVYAVGSVSAKFREKKEVNRTKVLDALGGDLDAYFTISNITQVAIKDFVKDNPEFKEGLMESIETVSKEVVDVEIDPSLASAQC